MRVKLSRRTKIGIAICSTLICLAVVGLYIAKQNYKPDKPTYTPPKNVVHYSAPAPSEKPVTSKTYHSTAVGNQPKYIRLPSIGAEGYIQAVGLDQNGAVAAPNNVSLAGWYADMLAPGQDGLSIIDGHVDGKTAPGIFHSLHKLTAGDAFEVDLANGQVVHYVVKNMSQVAASDAASQLFARDNTIPGQLNLITCGGTFNRAKGVYNDRVVVVAAQTR